MAGNEVYPLPQESNVIFFSFIEGQEEDKSPWIEKYYKGDVAKWASKRAHLLGDIIIPKHACIVLSGIVKDGQPTPAHHTYYVEHSGILATTEEEFHCHHLVCDCVLRKNLNDGYGGVNLNACPDLRAAARIRARRFGKNIRNDISEAQEIETDPYKISVMADKVALAAIETTLLVDHTLPEAWPGTVTSGELPVEQAIEVTGQPEENVIWYADVLQSRGRVSFDGQKLRLAS